jgi:hypothetical protein
MVGFESARSPVLAIHHSRVSDVGDDDFPRSISGLSLSTDEISPPRRNPSFSNDTTYVPMTPLPSNCILSFLDRPREMATLIAKNAELFRLIQHALSPDKYAQLQTWWKAPREVIPDDEWVHRTRSYIAMGPDDDEGGALWARWAELIGWDPTPSPDDVQDDEDWSFQPQDSAMHKRWNEVERQREDSGASWGSSVALGGAGIGLSEIHEEEELEEGEHRLGMGSMSKKS